MIQRVGDIAQGVVLDGVQGGVAGQLAVEKQGACCLLADFKLAQGIIVTVE